MIKHYYVYNTNMFTITTLLHNVFTFIDNNYRILELVHIDYYVYVWKYKFTKRI